MRLVREVFAGRTSGEGSGRVKKVRDFVSKEMIAPLNLERKYRIAPPIEEAL
jgi:hypothetical protein